ncbi:MAG: MBL fold metallo-hydrolase [Elainellaceae cyanobacterium]
MYLTYYGANSWLIELGQQRILVDPWLVGSLMFGSMNWLFKGDRTTPIDALPDNIDLILLSQGLEDHAHRPTLKALDRQIPVVASPNGAKVAEELGYTTITALAPGEATTIADQVEIRALSGAPIGLQVENGYLLRHLPTQASVYYEPHGFPPGDLDTLGQVDVVISPIVNLELPVAGAIIQGKKTAIALAQQLRPQVFLPTATGGNIVYEGLLTSVLKAVGNADEFRQELAQQNLTTEVMEPEPNVRFSVAIAQSVAP